MLIEKTCPMCGRSAYLNITKEQDKELTQYIFHGGKIQDKLKSYNKFEREFIKTGYCPECQSLLFGSKLEESDNRFFYKDELNGDVMEIFVSKTEGLKPFDAITSFAANMLSVNEKKLYLYEMELEKELSIDDSTGKVMRIGESK